MLKIISFVLQFGFVQWLNLEITFINTFKKHENSVFKFSNKEHVKKCLKSYMF